MKKFMPIIILFLMLTVPTASYAVGLELAVGGWKQSPKGYLSYEAVTANDELDLERDCNYDDETRFTARLKIDMPLFIPNIYLMASPMEFDGTGSKTVDFNFGDYVFDADVPFYSKITLDHYDIGLYYGIPFIETITAKTVNIDLGLNVRIYDFEVELKQDTTSIEESESSTLPVPMVYLALQIKPFDILAIEAEARGISYSGNQLYSLIGRVKFNVFGPVFAAAGYRYDKLKIDEDDVDVDVDFSGPFIEAGFKF
ncbi:MAG: TIGR04219 family outer membrane beta-barrel protein [Desulfobacterales bacterium]|nr:TIGR04219 family outer membrane beta-barrel protein [Desulfobacterales bacterium]MDX2509991.1 TIGR04219 family outer membrane beta-barrel protein [Desulfobacterales bacterium]